MWTAGILNWPASSVRVFIAQLGEHCSANAEATGSNPVEAPKIFFSGYFRNYLNCDSLRWSHTRFRSNNVSRVLARINIPLKGHKTIWGSRKLRSKPFSYFFSLNCDLLFCLAQRNHPAQQAIERWVSAKRESALGDKRSSPVWSNWWLKLQIWSIIGTIIVPLTMVKPL